MNIFVVGAVGAVFWTMAYALIIRRGFLDKTYGMPFVSLCANTSWELAYSFIFPQSNEQQIGNMVWFTLDLIIIYTYLHYGLAESRLTKWQFYLMFLLTFFSSLILVVTSALEFQDIQGRYSAFIIDFMMSILFIWLLFHRGNSRGQSVYIAVLKWLGSACYAIVFYDLYPTSLFLMMLFVLTFLFNFMYVVLLYRAIRDEGKDPLMRF